MIPATPSPEVKGSGVNEVSFAEFKKIDLRVARVLDVQDIPGADRIWKLLIDVGTEKKEIVAGVKEFYTREQLLGKSVIVVNNLLPNVIRGVESRGMLLAASSIKKAEPSVGGKDEKRLSILILEQDLPPGSLVG